MKQNVTQYIENHINDISYCPSREAGGFILNFCIALKFVMSTAHSCTSGLAVPGVGYLTIFVSGKIFSENMPFLENEAPDESQGYVINPTFVSLNMANKKCVPSKDDQIASGVAKISSTTKKCYILLIYLSL